MSLRRPPIPVVFRLLAGLLLVSQGGCMSALTTAAMREALRETVDSLAAASQVDGPRSGKDADVSARLATDETTQESGPVISEPQAPSLDVAVDRAVARLKGIGELDGPTQATLLGILEKTNPEDWPAAIDAFAASLEAYRPVPLPPVAVAAPPTPTPTMRTEPDAPLVFPASASLHDEPLSQPAVDDLVSEPESQPPSAPETDPHITAAAVPSLAEALLFPSGPTAAEPARLAIIEAARPVGPGPDAADDATQMLALGASHGPLTAEDPLLLPDSPAALEPPVAAAPPKAIEPVITTETPVAIELPVAIEPPVAMEPPVAIELPVAAAPPAPALVVRNACFVSRVRAWGVVDKFPEAVFRPGQDVIVYFELESPTARHSPAGHTTSIDTIFRLIAADGHPAGQWDFEPIEETCHSPRRDYFARYFVRIPETAPPGPYRLDLMVTDLVAGVSSQACLDLEVRP